MRRAAHYIPTMLVAVLITCMSLLREPPEIVPDKLLHIRHIDKYVHFVMYLCWSVCFALDYSRDHKKKENTRFLVLGLVCIALYGGLMELLQQAFCAPRTGDWWDFAADVLGVLITLTLVLYKLKRSRYAR